MLKSHRSVESTFAQKLTKLKSKIVQNLQLVRAHPHNGASFLYPDHLEIISGIGLLKDPKSLQILRVLLVHSGTVIVRGFNANEAYSDYQLIGKSFSVH